MDPVNDVTTIHSRGLGYGPPTLCGEPGAVLSPCGEVTTPTCPTCLDILGDPRKLAERATAVKRICGCPPREWATGIGGETDEVFENSERTAERVRQMNLLLTWNAVVPPGSRVAYRSVLHGTERETRTRSQAWALGHGAPMVLLEGEVGGWHLDFVRALGPAPEKGAVPDDAHVRQTVGHRVLRVARDLDVLAVGGDAARGIHPAACAADLRHCAEELGVEDAPCGQCGRPWPAHSMAELGACMDAAKARFFAACASVHELAEAAASDSAGGT